VLGIFICPSSILPRAQEAGPHREDGQQMPLGP
jgi:hypothetical protein